MQEQFVSRTSTRAVIMAPQQPQVPVTSASIYSNSWRRGSQAANAVNYYPAADHTTRVSEAYVHETSFGNGALNAGAFAAFGDVGELPTCQLGNLPGYIQEFRYTNNNALERTQEGFLPTSIVRDQWDAEHGNEVPIAQGRFQSGAQTHVYEPGTSQGTHETEMTQGNYEMERQQEYILTHEPTQVTGAYEPGGFQFTHVTDAAYSNFECTALSYQPGISRNYLEPVNLTGVFEPPNYSLHGTGVVNGSSLPRLTSTSQVPPAAPRFSEHERLSYNQITEAGISSFADDVRLAQSQRIESAYESTQYVPYDIPSVDEDYQINEEFQQNVNNDRKRKRSTAEECSAQDGQNYQHDTRADTGMTYTENVTEKIANLERGNNRTEYASSSVVQCSENIIRSHVPEPPSRCTDALQICTAAPTEEDVPCIAAPTDGGVPKSGSSGQLAPPSKDPRDAKDMKRLGASTPTYDGKAVLPPIPLSAIKPASRDRGPYNPISSSISSGARGEESRNNIATEHNIQEGSSDGGKFHTPHAVGMRLPRATPGQGDSLVNRSSSVNNTEGISTKRQPYSASDTEESREQKYAKFAGYNTISDGTRTSLFSDAALHAAMATPCAVAYRKSSSSGGLGSSSFSSGQVQLRITPNAGLTAHKPAGSTSNSSDKPAFLASITSFKTSIRNAALKTPTNPSSDSSGFGLGGLLSGSALCNQRSGLRTPSSALRTPGSGLRTPSSMVRNSGSGLRTPVSGRRTPASGKRTPGSARMPGGSARTPGSTKDDEDSVQPATVVVLMEGAGQARYTVGVAALELRQPRLRLEQFSDTQTYSLTLALLSALNPVQVLVPSTGVGKGVGKAVSEWASGASVSSVHRRYFREDLGLSTVRRLATPSCLAALVHLDDKHLCLASVAALLRYVENLQNVTYAPASLHVTYAVSDHTMLIEWRSCTELEVVRALDGGWRHSLFGALRHTKTCAGTRLLRASLLQPYAGLDAIERRLDTVQYLTENPALLQSIQSVLGRFPDLDWLLTMCSHQLNEESEERSEQRLSYVLGLKSTLELLEGLCVLLEGATDPQLQAIRQAVTGADVRGISEVLSGVLHEDARHVKGATAMRIQRCFAIRSNINGLLDVARKIYSELIDDITTHVSEVCEEHRVVARVGQTVARGFHIIIPTPPLQPAPKLPPIFMQVQKTRGAVTCTTELLYQLDQRARDSLREILVMSNKIVCAVIAEVRSRVSALHGAAEALAALDVVAALAHVAFAHGWQRPSLTLAPLTSVTRGRHPILDALSPLPPVPNDTEMSASERVLLITGPNMSGKSTYLRQVALLQVLAQMGSFVPAAAATLQVRKSLFAVLGSHDSIQKGASTFQMQMMEVGAILQQSDHRCLVVLDEVASRTNASEGAALCWAIVEALIKTRASVLLATHFSALTNMARLYPQIRNHHFATCASEGGKHHLRPGVTPRKNYGLAAASVSALPPTVVQSAVRISQTLLQPCDSGESLSLCPAAERYVAEHKLAHRLIKLAREMVQSGTLSPLHADSEGRSHHASDTSHTVDTNIIIDRNSVWNSKKEEGCSSEIRGATPEAVPMSSDENCISASNLERTPVAGLNKDSETEVKFRNQIQRTDESVETLQHAREVTETEETSPTNVRNSAATSDIGNDQDVELNSDSDATVVWSEEEEDTCARVKPYRARQERKPETKTSQFEVHPANANDSEISKLETRENGHHSTAEKNGGDNVPNEPGLIAENYSNYEVRHSVQVAGTDSDEYFLQDNDVGEEIHSSRDGTTRLDPRAKSMLFSSIPERNSENLSSIQSQELHPDRSPVAVPKIVEMNRERYNESETGELAEKPDAINEHEKLGLPSTVAIAEQNRSASWSRAATPSSSSPVWDEVEELVRSKLEGMLVDFLTEMKNCCTTPAARVGGDSDAAAATTSARASHS